MEWFDILDKYGSNWFFILMLMGAVSFLALYIIKDKDKQTENNSKLADILTDAVAVIKKLDTKYDNLERKVESVEAKVDTTKEEVHEMHLEMEQLNK